MVLDKLPVPGRPTTLDNSTARATALAVGAGGGCMDIFSLVYHFSFLSLSLWETARYRLKYCLKGPLSPKQPTNQLNLFTSLLIPDHCLSVFTLMFQFCCLYLYHFTFPFPFSSFLFFLLFFFFCLCSSPKSDDLCTVKLCQ